MIAGLASSHAPTLDSCPVSPASPCWTLVQKGFGSCTINAGQASCTKAFTFSPAYSVKPFAEASLNVTCGVNCSFAASTNSPLPNVPVGSQLFFQAYNATWFNMPVANTELNGFADQRASWTTPSSFTSQTGTFCISGGTTVGAAQMTVQSSTDQVTWTNMGSDGILVNVASNTMTCTTETIGLSVSTRYFFRVMGNDGFGPNNDQFGTIELFMNGQFVQGTISVSVACLPDLTGLTTTTITVGVTCGSVGISAGKTFTIDWWSGIAA